MSKFLNRHDVTFKKHTDTDKVRYDGNITIIPYLICIVSKNYNSSSTVRPDSKTYVNSLTVILIYLDHKKVHNENIT